MFINKEITKYNILTQVKIWMHQNDLLWPTAKTLINCRHIESLAIAIMGEYKIRMMLPHCFRLDEDLSTCVWTYVRQGNHLGNLNIPLMDAHSVLEGHIPHTKVSDETSLMPS